MSVNDPFHNDIFAMDVEETVQVSAVPSFQMSLRLYKVALACFWHAQRYEEDSTSSASIGPEPDLLISMWLLDFCM